MTTALTIQIARLRAAGCKVSTIIGHNPAIGSFQYSVTLPKGIPTDAQITLGHARMQHRPSEGRTLIWASVYRIDRPLDRQLIAAARVDAANLLGRFADHVGCFDQTGSASRQHYIETGRYLNKPEVEESNSAHAILSNFEAWAADCEAAQYTDTGEAWNHLNALADALRAIL